MNYLRNVCLCTSGSRRKPSLGGGTEIAVSCGAAMVKFPNNGVMEAFFGRGVHGHDGACSRIAKHLVQPGAAGDIGEQHTKR